MEIGEVGAHFQVAASHVAMAEQCQKLESVTIHNHQEVESPVSALILKRSHVKLQVVDQVTC